MHGSSADAALQQLDQLSLSPLTRDHILNPITALAFYKTGHGRLLVLAGEDVWIKVYEAQSFELLGQYQVFTSQPIHGIRVLSRDNKTSIQDDRVLVWGAHYVAVLDPDLLQEGSVRSFPEPQDNKAPDWIYDGLLSPYDSTHGVLLTAHNEIVPMRLTPDETNCSISCGLPISPSRPILYSGNLCWLSPTQVLVAGGTVFGEIVVWRYDANQDGVAACELLFVLTGHEGSIFGVTISPELELAPGAKVRLLASCSDDRTIRVWNITEGSQETPEGLIEQQATRETGFGGLNSETNLQQKDDSSRCLAVAMAHASRIWHVKFSGRKNHYHPQKAPIELFSYGEDSTRISWKLQAKTNLEENHEMPVARYLASLSWILNKGEISNCHTGKNMWSAAVLDTQTEGPLTATGGADGKIALLGDIGHSALFGEKEAASTQPKTSKRRDYRTLSFNEFTRSLERANLSEDPNSPTEVKKGEKDAFHSYGLLSDDTILLAIRSGRIFLGTTNEDATWKELTITPHFQADISRYNIMCSPCPGVAIIGTASGQLYLYESTRGLRELLRLDSKITEIIALPASSFWVEFSETAKPVTVLVTTLGKPKATIIAVDAIAETLKSHTYTLEPEQPFVITAASIQGGMVILGSRIGSVAIYHRTQDSFIQQDVRRDTTAKEAVTSITPLPGSADAFLATCRDGRYRIYTITSSNDATTAALKLRHESSPPLTVVDGARFMETDMGVIHLILYGFRGNSFVEWNESLQQEMAAVECGGGHRIYACTLGPRNSEQLRLVYTKAGCMHIYSQSRVSVRTLKSGGHGREIKAVAYHDGYLATAAEDTTIRIWRYAAGKGAADRQLLCLAVLEKHTAGIQCLQWVGSDSTLRLVSSAGNEELFIWRVTTLDSKYQGLAVVCEAQYSDRTSDGDLRILDFDVQLIRHATNRTGGTDDGHLLLSLVLSNSVLKTFLYTCSAAEFSFMAEGKYTGAALMQTKNLPAGEDQTYLHCLTASTDGHLAIWRAKLTSPLVGSHPPSKTEFSMAMVTRLHQSSIKSLDLLHMDERYLVVTGGDDNALGFLELARSSASPEYSVVSRSRVSSAHAAAVTGICVWGGASQGAIEVVSVSNDQRLRLWQVTAHGTEGVKVKLLENMYSSIADPGGLASMASDDKSGQGRKLLVVAGVGIEIWSRPSR